ncbi:DegT/DnrJ/EryC1/StrS family aminotransferase [Paenibacillus sp. ACRRX]|uniref:DegT/DnrJ/EryC1/StrS family aminotransferase n=1 Tax=Paenibacillus sp. ACRRX TaxID=2918206 RepID=UPI001EF49564|nr:DegT/DnrJ/EryC1/StrS family aminotransferase [Paenibacillus sp. ACRRX]MCG7408920.1 DegT/DnrJ/EryC1/StrS family aminotransferase [Paenibacillus sp. ACRRX]
MAAPIRTKSWPCWPMADEDTRQELLDVLDSGRWAISGAYMGRETKEQQFAAAFAQYNRIEHCLTLDHGTSALIAALEALEIGYGDEVIVPGLTWIAPAVAVLSVNAIPIMVDIEADTFCMSPEGVRLAITPRTKAILPIHMYGSMVDMDAIMQIAAEYNLYVIEDCAHSHGSVWRGQRAGTIGHIGAFSMQQGKVLTCGEGGAAITKDERLLAKMEASAWNARTKLPDAELRLGAMQLSETGGRFGTNRCLSEFQAAILLAQLRKLDDHHDVRASNVRYLNEHLREIPGVLTMRTQPQVDRQSYYGFVVRIQPDVFGSTASQTILSLQQMLGLGAYYLHEPYIPLHRNPLYTPHSRRHKLEESYTQALRTERFTLPQCDAAYDCGIVFHHSVLLGDLEDMQHIVEAFRMLFRYGNEGLLTDKRIHSLQ